MTTSSESTFPVTVGPDLTFNGAYDAFVAKVSAAGTGLDYCGYIGGSGDDYGFGMAVDDAGNAYLSGMTDSSETTFPVTGGPDLTFNGADDAFVAKVDPVGTALEYCGYIGGDEMDQGLGVALDANGNLIVIGHTHSDESTFPVVDGPDTIFNGVGENGDAFIAEVTSVPNDPVVTENLRYCGFLGGAGEDAALWVDLDLFGNAYVVGDTSSDEATFPVMVGPWLMHNGGVDAFVAKVAQDPLMLSFESDRVTFTWPPVGNAQSYNVYRALLSDLLDGDGNGLPDNGYGSCLNHLDDDVTDTVMRDPEFPMPPGEGFSYLTSFVVEGQESALGTSSSGLARQVLVPCP